MSTTDIDREEWLSARDAAYRDGEDIHPIDCKCRDCLVDEYDAQEEHR